jgi:ABC-type enterobactin transport system permease subunit
MELKELVLKRKNSFRTWMIISAAILIAAAVLALCAGQYQVPVDQVISILMGQGEHLAECFQSHSAGTSS